MIYILGRQPAIGIAELESLCGAKNIEPLGNVAVRVKNSDVDFTRLGGSIKSAVELTVINTKNFTKILETLEKIILEKLKNLPKGKIKLGVSTYNVKASPARVNALGLTLKKKLRASGKSVRLVPNVENSLSSAQVLHNKLTEKLGIEIILIEVGANTIIAQTTNVQDIESYTLRDRGRPKRDARVGMLPPKLAQTIVNLAVEVVSTVEDKKIRVLDPFCGTGVILQEAALMSYAAYGTDLEERMIHYSRNNLNWLSDRYKISFDWYLHAGDATNISWQKPFDVLATETYLGRPFTSVPDNNILQKTIGDCDTIMNKFLENLAKQTQPGFRACLAVPAWFVGGKIHHLKTLDHLGDLGYNRISFVHSKNEDLIYHREGQVVGRELLVISRK